MPGSSSMERDPSPPPPPPPADDEEDAAVDESTPFLASNDPEPAIPTFRRTIHILTALALTFSVLTLASLFATAIARQTGPVSFNLPWSTQDGLKGVIAPAIFSFLFSAYNLRRLRSNKPTAPLFLNLLVDILIAIFGTTHGAVGLWGLLDGRGGWCSYPGGDHSFCSRGVLPVQVFAGIAMGAGMVFGLVHLALFGVRCWVAYCSGLGSSSWRFPGGQLKFEVSIQFLREPERETREGTV